MESQEVKGPLILGSYPFRGQANFIRLVCEYLHCPYVDRFFNPDEWKEFKEKETKGWVIKDMPFLQHGDFSLTGNLAMITYIIDICDRQELLGRTLDDKTKMDFMTSKSLRDEIVDLLCDSKVSTLEEEAQKMQQMADLYEKKVVHNVEFHQRECMPNNFYLGYLSIVDFGMYELVNHFQIYFPGKMARFTKLQQLRDRVAAIPEIIAYQASERSLSLTSPMQYFRTFKEEQSKVAQGTIIDEPIVIRP